MLVGIEGTLITVQCEWCKRLEEVDIKDKEVEFIEELKLWDSLYIPCQCGAVEGFNMNLSLKEDKSLSLDPTIIDKEKEKYKEQFRLVKNLMKLVRKDLKTKGEEIL
jgi:hypothetical protein